MLVNLLISSNAGDDSPAFSCGGLYGIVLPLLH